MKSVRNFRGFHSRLMATSAAVFILMFTTNVFSSAVEKVIYSFAGSPDGLDPSGNLIADKAGNLYGTTNSGGRNMNGTVFELSRPTNPGDPWTETVLYVFNSRDGSRPANGLVFDKAGNLYGATVGGASNLGTIFELTPPATTGGTWTETILYIFPDQSHGYYPFGNLIFDTAGNLYGTTLYGGGVANCTCGTVFELSPPATQGGAWTQTVLYSFGAFSGDGVNPVAGLIFDRSGALYGTTTRGGSLTYGAVFELVREHGIWTENILYSFGTRNGDGRIPEASLTFDGAGNLYGTTSLGAIHRQSCTLGCGVVFELQPPAVAGDPWTETTIYSFTGGKDGAFPQAGVIFDKTGNLYGTAFGGGLKNKVTSNNGSVFELSPPSVAGGMWTETTLYNFGGHNYSDGSGPDAGLVFVRGKFYGTTISGGPQDLGTAFSLVITP